MKNLGLSKINTFLSMVKTKTNGVKSPLNILFVDM